MTDNFEEEKRRGKLKRDLRIVQYCSHQSKSQGPSQASQRTPNHNGECWRRSIGISDSYYTWLYEWATARKWLIPQGRIELIPFPLTGSDTTGNMFHVRIFVPMAINPLKSKNIRFHEVSGVNCFETDPFLQTKVHSELRTLVKKF